MKFICDHMLVRLGRWLRAAGYDTWIISDQTPDSHILKMAIQERRYLLTRDRHFLNRQDDGWVVYLEANHFEECVQQLSGKLAINWLEKPLTRCLICNTKLLEQQTDIPPDLDKKTPILFCSRCRKIYWEGGHAKKMIETLQKWQTSSKKGQYDEL